eukprot:2138829-Prymnesium_polylepis.1
MLLREIQVLGDNLLPGSGPKQVWLRIGELDEMLGDPHQGFHDLIVERRGEGKSPPQVVREICADHKRAPGKTADKSGGSDDSDDDSDDGFEPIDPPQQDEMKAAIRERSFVRLASKHTETLRTSKGATKTLDVLKDLSLIHI